jgi:hypothetical protein
MNKQIFQLSLHSAALLLSLLATAAEAAHGTPVTVATLNADHGSVTGNGGQNGSAGVTKIATVQVATLQPMAVLSDDPAQFIVYPFWVAYSDSSALLDIAINLAKPAILDKLFVNCASSNKSPPVSEFEISTPGTPVSNSANAEVGNSANAAVAQKDVYSSLFWPSAVVEGSSTLVLTSLNVPVQSRLIIEPLAPSNTVVQFCNGSAVFRVSNL